MRQARTSSRAHARAPLAAFMAIGAALTINGCVAESGKGQQQQIEGELKTTILTNVESSTLATEYFLEDGRGEWIRLHFDREPDFLPGLTRVRALGAWRSEPMHFQVSSLELLDDGTRTGALAATAPVVRKVAVIMTTFQNDPRQSQTEDQVRSIIFTAANSANAYFKEDSYGLKSLTGKLRPDGDVFGWYTIAQDNTTCDYSSWGNAGRAAAQAAGVDLTGYDHIVHFFSAGVNCGWGGVGQVPGKYTWLASTQPSTAAHELGHNFGLHHASTWSCADASNKRVPIISDSAKCKLDEYGDPFDVMGRGYRHGGAYQKGRLGFFGDSNKATATTTGTFNLVPIETSSPGLQSLRVRRDSTTYYYVEYRQPFGLDNFRTTDPVVNGVLIHVAPDYATLDRPKLLDMTSATNSFTDAALPVGQTFADPQSGISITLNSRTSASASVTITFPGSPPPGGSGGAGGGVDGGTDGRVDSGSGGSGSGGAGTGGAGSGGAGSGGSGTGGAGGSGGSDVGTGLKGEYFDNVDLTALKGSH